MTTLAFIFPIVLVFAVLATSCALCGVLLTVRRQAMLPDALAHAVLPGIVSAAFLRGGALDPVTVCVAALGASLTAVWLVKAVEARARTTRAAALATVYSGMLALGLVLMRLTGLDQTGFDFHVVLFGSLDLLFWPQATGFVSFDGAKLAQALATAPLGFLLGCTGLALSLVLIGLGHRVLAHNAFDAQHFSLQTPRTVVVMIEALFLGAILATAVAAFLSVGAIMAVSLFAAPALAARTVSRSFSQWLIYAVYFGLGVALFCVVLVIVLPELLLPAMGLTSQPVILGISLSGTYAVISSVLALVLVARAR